MTTQALGDVTEATESVEIISGLLPESLPEPEDRKESSAASLSQASAELESSDGCVELPVECPPLAEVVTAALHWTKNPVNLNRGRFV